MPFPSNNPSRLPAGVEPHTEPVWLTVGEVMRRTRLSQRTVRRYAAEGRLPAYKFGRNLRFRAEDVDALARPLSA